MNRRCSQTQCNFYTQGGCKDCQECGAEPYIINTKCERCMSCENIANSLRWDDADKVTEKELLQELVILAQQRLKELEEQQEEKPMEVIQ